LDHGVVDTLGLVGAIMPATLNCEFDTHFRVRRSTDIGSKKSSTGHAAAASWAANLRPPGISSCITNLNGISLFRSDQSVVNLLIELFRQRDTFVAS
jgi:hypothetical protein